MKTLWLALSLLASSLVAAAQSLTVVGPKWSLTWDKSPETNVVSYLVSVSATNYNATNAVISWSATAVTNGVSLGQIFAGRKSGSYTMWVQARNSDGLLSVLDDSASVNVFWFPPPFNLTIQRQ